MIVRDESALLRQFFAAATGLWDDLCVVDTGSVDDTINILQDVGARIFTYPWNNDFAAPRNFGLQQARGDWIMCLDADEMVSEAFVTEIRGILADDSLGAVTIPIRSALIHGHYALTHLLRMFRHDPSIQFEHPIHEDVVTSTLAYLGKHGKELGHAKNPVQHLGYTRQRATERDKKTRDLCCLRRAIALNPDDLYCWYKMLEVARFWNDKPLLRDTAIQAEQALWRAPVTQVASAHYMGEMVAMMAQGLHGDGAQAVEMLDAWESGVRPNAAFYYHRGQLRETSGDVVGARADFETCFDLARSTANIQLATVRPHLGLARLALLQGDLADALHHIDAALQHNPRDPETLLALTTAIHCIGGKTAIAQITDAYISTHGDLPELHAALGETAWRQGDAHTAVTELRHALGDAPQGPLANMLVEALHASGADEEAQDLAQQLESRR